MTPSCSTTVEREVHEAQGESQTHSCGIIDRHDVVNGAHDARRESLTPSWS
jgi:hypothetical protein